MVPAIGVLVMVACTGGEQALPGSDPGSTGPDEILRRVHALATQRRSIDEASIPRVLQVTMSAQRPGFSPDRPSFGPDVRDLRAAWLDTQVSRAILSRVAGPVRPPKNFAIFLSLSSAAGCITFSDVRRVVGGPFAVPPAPNDGRPLQPEMPYYGVSFPLGDFPDGFRALSAGFHYKRCANSLLITSYAGEYPYTWSLRE
jgi:hypothetical protein